MDTMNSALRSMEQDHANYYPECPTSPQCIKATCPPGYSHGPHHQWPEAEIWFHPKLLWAVVYVLHPILSFYYTGGFRVGGWPRQAPWGHISFIMLPSPLPAQPTVGGD